MTNPIPPPLSPAQIQELEQKCQILDEAGAERMCEVFTLEWLQNLDSVSRAGLLEQLNLAAQWHEARGRLKLSRRFKALAATVEAIQKGKVN